MEIIKGIHQVPKVRGANSYLRLVGNDVTVIDAGLPGSADRIVDYVKEIGLLPTNVKSIVVTHPDMDHAGGVSELKEATGARVAVHEADAAGLSGEKAPKTAKGAMGLVMKAARGFMKIKPVKPDIILKDGDTIDGLLVIHTPGHTVGSICLYIPQAALFVGDALRTDDDGRPKLSPDLMNEDTRQAKESVRRIASLEFSTLLPGHGPPIVENASTFVKEFVASGFK
jgi:hydroxyacylglutathione hydrolase